MLPSAASGGLADANERLIISAGRENASGRASGSPDAAAGRAPGRTRRVVLAVAGVTSLLLIAALCGVVGWATVANGMAHRSAGASAAGADLSNQIPLPVQRSTPSSGRLDEPFCLSLSDPGQSMCLDYLNAAGSERFRIANEWGRVEADSYGCAGITSTCLDADLVANKPGASTCKPRKGCAEMRAFKLAEASEASDGPSYNGQGQRQLTPDEEFLENITPAPPAPKDPVSGWGWYSARPLPDQAGTRIPATFLATSHEWDRMPDYVQNVDAFRGIFREFGPSPIIRIGGASQDFLKEPPPSNIWEAMAKMHQEFGAVFLIGLPLWRVDAIDDAREMMKIAEKYLPKNAIMGYELGNEPEFWLTGHGGYDEKTSKWTPGWEAYNDYFHRTALKLNPCGSKPMLAGPGWGNVNTIDGKYLADLAKKDNVKCYMREMSVHYYPYVNNVTIDAKGLLEQNLQNFGLEKFNWLNRIASGSGFGIRISETNSLYGGGRSGLSDTMAGALWCADALFAFANAGATGFHFHWGFGGQPLIGGQPNTGVQTNFFNITDRVPSGEVGGPYPSIHAPCPVRDLSSPPNLYGLCGPVQANLQYAPASWARAPPPPLPGTLALLSPPAIPQTCPPLPLTLSLGPSLQNDSPLFAASPHPKNQRPQVLLPPVPPRHRRRRRRLQRHAPHEDRDLSERLQGQHEGLVAAGRQRRPPRGHPQQGRVERLQRGHQAGGPLLRQLGPAAPDDARHPRHAVARRHHLARPDVRQHAQRLPLRRHQDRVHPFAVQGLRQLRDVCDDAGGQRRRAGGQARLLQLQEGVCRPQQALKGP